MSTGGFLYAAAMICVVVGSVVMAYNNGIKNRKHLARMREGQRRTQDFWREVYRREKAGLPPFRANCAPTLRGSEGSHEWRPANDSLYSAAWREVERLTASEFDDDKEVKE